MSKIYLIIDNDIQNDLLRNHINIADEFKKQFNKEFSFSYVPTPLTEKHNTRDMALLIDTLSSMSINDIYELLKYSKNMIKLIKMTKTRYLRIYKKDNNTNENKLEKTIKIDDKDYMEQLQQVITDTAEYVFEIIVSEENEI